MGNVRAFGEEWTELSGYKASLYEYPEVSDAIGQTKDYQAREDILEGLRYGLLYSAILWAALIAAGVLIFG